MGLFHRTLTSARGHAVAGELKEAKNELSYLFADVTDADRLKGVVIRLRNNLDNYNKDLKSAYTSEEQSEIVDSIDNCFKYLNLIKRDLKKLTQATEEEKIKIKLEE